MKKFIIFIASFIIGLILFLPYKFLYTYATDKITTRYKIPLVYKIDKAHLFSVRYKDLKLNLPNMPLNLPPTKLSVNPIGYFTDGNFCYIHSSNIKGNIKALKNVYLFSLNINNLKDLPIKGLLLDGLLKFDVSKDYNSGNLVVSLTKLKLPLMTGAVDINKVWGKIRFQNHRINIEELSIGKPLNIKIKGFVMPNLKRIDDSYANLTINLHGKKSKIKGPMKNLLKAY